MAPPSRLKILASSVLRLLKEEESYHKELVQQRKRIETLENAEEKDENADYELKQERRALEETNAVFPSLHKKIAEAAAQLQTELDTQKTNASSDSSEDIEAAREALAKAKPFVERVGT